MPDAILLPAPEVARHVADALEGIGAPYAIGGAIAYGYHGPPRATNDVDVNVFVEPESLGPILDALEVAGAVVDKATSVATARDRGDFIVRYGGMRVDVFTPSIELSYSAAGRVQRLLLLGRPINVLSAEDLVLFKLLFFRPKDLFDIERLVRFRGGALDYAYVRRWIVDMMGEDDERTRAWDHLVDAR